MAQKLAIGIDIGGTNVSFGIITQSGKVLYKESFPIKNFKTVEDFIDYIGDRIRISLNELTIEYELKGIGIGAPNGNYYTGTIEYAPNLVWKGIIPLAKLLEDKTGYPVLLTNDANAAAIGEMTYGNAKGCKDFLMITLGTGLGSGFVANGELILGHDGFAGELGHSIFDPDGRMCGCGRKGCLEQYASAPGIVKTVLELLERSGEESILRDISADILSSEIIYKAALKHDTIALKAFDYTGYVLGVMLANAVSITSPEIIILFGGLAKAEDLIFKPVEKYMEENLLNIYKNKIKIKDSALPENNAAILGAAALILKEKVSY